MQAVWAIVSLFFLVSCASIQKTESVAVVAWDSPEGVSRLERSRYKADFFKLANQFENQSNKIYCGPTTAAIVLNALLGASENAKPPRVEVTSKRLKRHLPKDFDPNFNRFSQENFFNDDNAKIKSIAQVFGQPIQGKKDFGLQVRQLSKMLQTHPVQAKLKVVDDSASEATIRQELRENLAKSGDFVIVNYARKSLGQEGGGHISPLGAYDEASDSFLVMDVNPNKAPWVWVQTPALVAAMRTFDTVENRGYILVKTP